MNDSQGYDEVCSSMDMLSEFLSVCLFKSRRKQQENKMCTSTPSYIAFSTCMPTINHACYLVPRHLHHDDDGGNGGEEDDNILSTLQTLRPGCDAHSPGVGGSPTSISIHVYMVVFISPFF